MHLYWLFLAPILLAIALFLSSVLIKEKKRVGLVFLGILSVFDLYFVFNPINIFRIDFDGAVTIAPLGCYLAHLKKTHFKKQKIISLDNNHKLYFEFLYNNMIKYG